MSCTGGREMILNILADIAMAVGAWAIAWAIVMLIYALIVMIRWK
jgi:hypothetical protein